MIINYLCVVMMRGCDNDTGRAVCRLCSRGSCEILYFDILRDDSSCEAFFPFGIMSKRVCFVKD